MSILKEKSYQFALKAIKIGVALQKSEREYVLSRQLIRSGTAVGALVEEAGQAESRADFIHKLSIANKEAHETRYWLRLIKDSGFQCVVGLEEPLLEIEELIKLLVSSIKTSKSN